MLKRVKKAIKEFLQKLAEENEKAFGKNTLDCCKLNQTNGSKK